MPWFSTAAARVPAAYIMPGMLTQYWSSCGGSRVTSAQITVTNSTLRYSAKPAIQITNGSGVVGSLTLDGSVVSDNLADGIQVKGQFTTTVSNSSFVNNTLAGVSMSHGQPITIANSLFNNNAGYAAVLAVTGQPLVLSGNSGTGNHYHAIQLSGSYNNIDLAPQGSIVYQMLPSGLVAGKTMTVRAGTIVKLSATFFEMYGSLLVQGTAESPVVFTSWKDDTFGGDSNGDGSATSPAPGDWVGIAAQGLATIDHAVVQYGGGTGACSYIMPGMLTQYWSSCGGSRVTSAQITVTNSTLRYSAKPAIQITNGSGVVGSLTLDGSVVSDNLADGIQVKGQFTTTVSNSSFVNNTLAGVSMSHGQPITIANSLFNNNAGYAAVLAVTGQPLVLSGNSGTGNHYHAIQLSGSYNNIDLAPQGSIVYQMLPSGLVAGKTMTVRAGTIVKLSATFFEMYGSLLVQGTAESPVVFTSWKDDTFGGDSNGDGSATSPAPGDWVGIAAQGLATIDHAVVQYGGGTGACSYVMPGMISQYWSSCGGSRVTSAQITVTNSTLRYSARPAVYLQPASGISVTAVVNNSNIYSNGQYGIYNGISSAVVNAENNWWGSDFGPAPYGPGNGINYRTYTCGSPPVTCYDYGAYVDAVPWLGQQMYYGQSVPNVVYEGDPVNTANGNYAYQRTDVSIPTRGLPLAFARAYNSLAPEAGPLGYGWRHTWQVTAQETASDVRITYGDGRQIRFTPGGGGYIGDPGVFATLVKSGGVFHLTEKDQTVYRFDSQGRLASVGDRNGNTTTLAYDGQGRLVTVTEPAGRALTFAYTSPVGTTLISQVTDHTARTMQYAYDSAANLVSVTDVTGAATAYTYDASHHLLTVTDANVHTFVRNVYNTGGRVVEQYDGLNHKWTFAYDEVNHKTVVTDPLGRATTYQYDANLRLTSEKDALNQTVSYVYDADNNRTQVTDKRSNLTRYAYDGRGNTTVITDTLGYTRTFTYDAMNNLLNERDPLGRATTYAYDAHSNTTRRTDALSGVTTWAYNAYGQVTSTTDANSHTTTYGYDANGNRTSTTDALGHTTSATYDSAGRTLTETDPLGRVTTYTYDAANRVLSIREPLGKTTAYAYDAVGNRITVTENGIRNTQYAYDAKDRLASVTDPLSHTTTYGYDAVDNQVTITNALGLATTFTYDALNRRVSAKDALNNTTSYEYDPNGNRTKLTDAKVKATTYTYDALNRLTGVTDAAGGTITYTYDAAGNRTSMTDANSHTTSYAYDALDRLTSTTDPLNHVTGYGYDAVSNRTSQARPDGTTVTYAFDALNRLAGSSYPGGSISYAYDAAGNRATLSDSSGTTTYTYDDLDRLTQAVAPTGTVGYGYDLFGNRTSLTYPGSQTVTYAYDLANRLTAVTDYAARTTQYTYDAANRPTGIQYSNGVRAAYTYDAADRLLSLIHTHPVNGTIASATYTLDAVGNRLSMQDLDGTTSYLYDNLYRLTQVTYPGGEQVTYAYDPMGNRTSLVSTVSGTTSYTYDAADRLLTAGATSLAWDDNGRMTGKGSATYAYDALDRLTQVVNGATTVGFAYNGDGVRLSKTVNGTATTYLQDVQSSLPVVLTETTGGQTSRYIYGNDLLERADPAGNPEFYHADGLGSTRALSNLAGQQTDAYSYDVFGATRSQTGGNGQPFTFTGEEMDGELGAIYLRARYYDPVVGRFVSKDPVAANPDQTQDMNRFSYSGNNPIHRTDPSGLTWQIFAAWEPGLVYGLARVGSGGRLTLDLTGGLPDVYVSGSAGAKVGYGLDASLGPKVGISYEGTGGLDFLPSWAQTKVGKLKLPFLEVGLTAQEKKYRIDVALRTGVGFAYEPQLGFEAKWKSSNLKGKLGDWIFDQFIGPRNGSSYYSGGGYGGGGGAGGGFGGGGGGSWGGPPSQGKSSATRGI